jgi:hypothetical protein
MRLLHRSSLVAGGITLALLTGCSGGNTADPAVGGAIVPAATQAESSSGPLALRNLLLPGMPTNGTGVAVHPFIDFAAMAKNKGPTIAISLREQQGVVDLFTATGTHVGRLTGFVLPEGMASDSKGDLYVVDSANARVQIYAAGFKSPPTTLSDPGWYPLDVDSFANGAYVAVTNPFTQYFRQGSVSIYVGSQPGFSYTITYPTLQQPSFCAFDGKGNLYVDGLDNNGNFIVGEIPNVSSGGSTFEQLTTTNTIVSPGGIQVTTAGGQIAIEDAGAQAIYTYNPPSGGSLGTPTQITPLGGSTDPLTFAFTKNMTNLYAVDNATGDAFEYAYPTGGTPVSTITAGTAREAPYGTALIPAQYPGNGR